MNLLLTGAFDWTECELNMLRELGHDVIFMQWENSTLPCEPAWVEGIVGNGIFLHHPIENFTALRFIQLTSAGYDRIPMDYVIDHKIQIFNARGVYSVPMAEFAVGGVLQLYKQSRYFIENQRAHKWVKNRGLSELYGKTVCIVGCGSVGNECAKRFAAFGCRVIGVDINPYQNELYEKIDSLDALDAILEVADVVVLTLPLTERTTHLISLKRLKMMKSGAVLVNIARGAIVETDSLVTALRTNLGGAVLDVVDTEPLAENSPLWDMDHVILSPHNSFVSDGNHARMLAVIMNNLEGSSI